MSSPNDFRSSFPPRPSDRGPDINVQGLFPPRPSDRGPAIDMTGTSGGVLRDTEIVGGPVLATARPYDDAVAWSRDDRTIVLCRGRQPAGFIELILPEGEIAEVWRRFIIDALNRKS